MNVPQPSQIEGPPPSLPMPSEAALPPGDDPEVQQQQRHSCCCRRTLATPASSSSIVDAVASRSFAHLLFAFLTVSLASGLVYGWPVLRRSLLSSGSTLSEKNLGAIFTAGAWSTQGGRFLFGLARDRFGTRSVASTSLLLVSAGSLGISLSDPSNGAALGVSTFCLGLGSGAQLCVQPVAGLFERKRQGAVLASLSGAFQISGLVFLALTGGGRGEPRRAGFGSFAALMLLWAVTAFAVLPRGKSYVQQSRTEEGVTNIEVMGTLEANGNVEPLCDNRLDREVSDIVALSKTETNGELQATLKIQTMVRHLREDCSSRVDEKVDDGGDAVEIEVWAEHGTAKASGGESDVKGVVLTPIENRGAEAHSASEASIDEPIDQGGESLASATSDAPTEAGASAGKARDFLLTAEYVGLVAWFSICLIPLQYYVATIGLQLERRGDDSGLYADLFSILYASAAAFSPLAGKIADWFGLGISQSIASVLSAVSMFVLATDANLASGQTVGMACYGLGRMIVFGSYFANVGKRFGYVHYGTLAGTGLLVSAVASLLQYPLIAAAADGSERPVNAGCGVVLLATLPYCAWLGRKERRVRSGAGAEVS